MIVKFLKTKIILILAISLFSASYIYTQAQFTLMKPDRVFDGETMHTDWVVLIKGNRIEQAGPLNFKLPEGTTVIELKGMTLLPGLIDCLLYTSRCV